MTCNSTQDSIYYSRISLHACGFTNIILCTVGTFFNFFIYMVYTQKYMMSPMHTIIANLAIVDIISMISYTPHSWQELIRAAWKPIQQHRTKTWEWCSYYSWHLTSMFTNISIWLTMMLAVWRYIGIIHPLKERSWCNPKTTRFSMVACYIMGVMISIPAFLVSRVEEREKLIKDGTGNCTKIKIYEVRIELEDNDFKLQITSIFYGVLVKILPSVVLAIISYKLVMALRKAECRHEILTRHTSTLSNVSNALGPRNSLRTRHTAKITKMLLIVLIIFMIGELPHGICCLLTAIFGTKFYYNHYYYLSEIFNTINYFCTCTYFIVYYTMSNKFKNTFKALVRCKKPSPALYQNTFASCNYNLNYHCNSPTVNYFPQSFFNTGSRA